MSKNKKQQVNIQASKEELKGAYSNVLKATHTRDEFVLDFLNIVGGQGTLSSRVILSPAQLKRVIMTMQDNLKKYEDKFGEIEVKARQDSKEKIGFQAD